ncbi:MAG: ClpXP protease specificity-enhancing factor SspB [Rickettsiales bacterium]|jgi:hypothetical protein|nr:ClpXP protease specificity-enhancing factor SspB [Rickettsiales bacterium]
MNINYQIILERALKSVVRDALEFAQINGLGDNAALYLTFRTRCHGVVIPDFLKMRYPDLMTVVLQYSFTNLNISDTEFGVTLTFDGNPYYIRIPYAALIEFKDPNADFILQFQPDGKNDLTSNDLELPLTEKPAEDPRVISLDDFRKNKL